MRRDLEKQLPNEKHQQTSLANLSPVYLVFNNTSGGNGEGEGGWGGTRREREGGREGRVGGMGWGFWGVGVGGVGRGLNGPEEAVISLDAQEVLDPSFDPRSDLQGHCSFLRCEFSPLRVKYWRGQWRIIIFKAIITCLCLPSVSLGSSGLSAVGLTDAA